MKEAPRSEPRRRLALAKYHGCGNDFLILDGRARELQDPGGLARKLCARRTGIGADGLLVLTSVRDAAQALADEAVLGLRIFNADGGEAEASGNGLRCAARYALDRGLVEGDRFDVWTVAGRRQVRVADGAMTVEMGHPVFPNGGAVEEVPTVDGKWSILRVSLGNPHAVLFVDDLRGYPVESVGPALERGAAFQGGTNVEFVRVRDRDALDLRVWERGVGETQACGTGACAALAAAVRTGRAAREASVRMRGGTLHVEWAGDGVLWLTGPAEYACDASVEV